MQSQIFRITYAVACVAAASGLLEAQVHLTSACIHEVDELSPVNIGHAVPTGQLRVGELDKLNLPVWAQIVFNASCVAVSSAQSDPAGQLQKIVGRVQASIDPDFSVHACVAKKNGSCSIELGPKEDKNRYLDFMLTYEYGDGASNLRFVVAEDAAKAVNYPLSFDVVVHALYRDGSPLAREYLGIHHTVVDAGDRLDREGLYWANSALIHLIVTTTESWPWQCTPRNAGSDFYGILKKTIESFEDSAEGHWDVRLVPLNSTPTITKHNGIALKVEYALCGHLMLTQLAIESNFTISEKVFVV